MAGALPALRYIREGGAWGAGVMRLTYASPFQYRSGLPVKIDTASSTQAPPS